MSEKKHQRQEFRDITKKARESGVWAMGAVYGYTPENAEKALSLFKEDSRRIRQAVNKLDIPPPRH